VEIVHSDSSAVVDTANAPALGGVMLLVACLVKIFLTINLLVLPGKGLFLYH
jgi:hypothetical protein